MTLKRLVLLATLCSAFLCGCSDSEKEAQIASLTSENVRLSAEIQTLKATLDSLNEIAQAKQKSLSDLDMDVK